MDDKKLKASPGQKRSRRSFLKGAAALTAAGSAGLLTGGCGGSVSAEAMGLQWEKFFKKNYRLMTPEEKQATVDRLERLARIRHDLDIEVSNRESRKTCSMVTPSISPAARAIWTASRRASGKTISIGARKPRISASLKWIRASLIRLPVKAGTSMRCRPRINSIWGCSASTAKTPPCISLPDQGHLAGARRDCRGRLRLVHRLPLLPGGLSLLGGRFNWGEPEVPMEEINRRQHYLGNRMRMKGVMEKCTFCIQRSREGRLPACAEACPTGSRVFGNLLDPDSEIRFVLKNKKVFRFKEDLGTDPKFWYFMD